MTTTDSPKAGYAPATTLVNFTNEMAGKPEMLPPRIDSSIMRGMSGATQSQLLITLRFLGLVEGEDDSTTEAFSALVTMPEDDRKIWFAEAVRRCYPEAMKLSDEGGTSGQLAELFENLYGYRGSTRDKAIRFYLQLAQYGDLKTSPHFAVPRATPKRGSGSGSGKRARKDRQDSPTPPAPRNGSAESNVDKANKTTKTVELRSGGTVTLSYDVDLFEVSDEDQEFVLGLIKELRGYEQRRALPVGDVTGND